MPGPVVLSPPPPPPPQNRLQAQSQPQPKVPVTQSPTQGTPVSTTPPPTTSTGRSAFASAPGRSLVPGIGGDAGPLSTQAPTESRLPPEQSGGELAGNLEGGLAGVLGNQIPTSVQESVADFGEVVSDLGQGGTDVVTGVADGLIRGVDGLGAQASGLVQEYRDTSLGQTTVGQALADTADQSISDLVQAGHFHVGAAEGLASGVTGLVDVAGGVVQLAGPDARRDFAQHVATAVTHPGQTLGNAWTGITEAANADGARFAGNVAAALVPGAAVTKVKVVRGAVEPVVRNVPSDTRPLPIIGAEGRTPTLIAPGVNFYPKELQAIADALYGDGVRPGPIVGADAPTNPRVPGGDDPAVGIGFVVPQEIRELADTLYTPDGRRRDVAASTGSPPGGLSPELRTTLLDTHGAEKVQKLEALLERNGLTPETPVYRWMDPAFLNPDGTVSGNPKSIAAVRDVYGLDPELRQELIDAGFEPSLADQIATPSIDASRLGPGLNVSLSPLDGYSGGDRVLVRTTIGDFLREGGLPYPDKGGAHAWVFTLPEGRSVPYELIRR